jgi:hypothetical protein
LPKFGHCRALDFDQRMLDELAIPATGSQAIPRKDLAALVNPIGQATGSFDQLTVVFIGSCASVHRGFPQSSAPITEPFWHSRLAFFHSLKPPSVKI